MLPIIFKVSNSFSFLQNELNLRRFYLVFSKKKGAVSLRDIKYGEGSKRGLALLSDRTFLNMHEQSLAILFSVWLHGIIVHPSDAANTLWFYITFRVFYPLGFRKGPPFLFLSTFPNYFAIFYSWFRILTTVISS
uniref:Uncharacterized protein n=1 Tax=Aureoumbra lagunensis TaxID=44058 RepID=A0A7S3K1K8_9STRA